MGFLQDIVELLKKGPDSPVAEILGHERLTITGNVGRLLTVPDGAKSFVGILETAQVRFQQGTAPTATTGELFEVGQQLRLSIDQIHSMDFIRTGGTSGVYDGHYWNVEKP